jgi:hypothetical protein
VPSSGDLTRANLRALVDGLAVDYEGILPEHAAGRRPERQREPHGGHRPRQTRRARTVSQTIVDGYRGPTADAFAYTAACSGS